MARKTTLQTIFNQFCEINHNEDNYSIGGGLDGSKFASRRHENARNDSGKLTLGEATQLFKKATGLDVDAVKEILEYAVPNMEWHHAGKLPKSYGGGMKKTYFLNASEICDISKNWDSYLEKLQISKVAEKNAADEKRSLEARQQEFLKANAKRFERVKTTPDHSFITSQEMNGKYGWFDSTYKSYNLPEYFSGWAFETAEKRAEYFNIK